MTQDEFALPAIALFACGDRRVLWFGWSVPETARDLILDAARSRACGLCQRRTSDLQREAAAAAATPKKRVPRTGRPRPAALSAKPLAFPGRAAATADNGATNAAS